jgi:MoaA/NifB/PqqE/SkfB family radical SAM enzyme
MMTPKKPLPRLPLEGMLDLTYRCDNHCLHCWLWFSSTTQEIQAELSFEEIRRIVDEARQMGCQAWKISGGEPMLRPDFPEIFDYITRKAEHYNLSTNGGLITPEIAQLMTRRGLKMVALYGPRSKSTTGSPATRGPLWPCCAGWLTLKKPAPGSKCR